MRGPCKNLELSNVALCDTEYLKMALKRSNLDKKIKDLIKQGLANTLPFLTFCINHTPIRPTIKTIKAHVCSATNPTALPRKLEIAPTTLPTIADNASTAFAASLLSAFASLSNHFFKIPSSFHREPPVPPSPPKTPVIARKVVEIVIERAVSIENMVMTCSRNRERILSAKDVF